MAYKDFDPTQIYRITYDSRPFIPTLDWWKYKVYSYNQQDLNAKRKIEDNITEHDFLHFKHLFDSGCHICGEEFNYQNRPTLDRIDSDKSHTKDNCLPCCAYCNTIKSNSMDSQTISFFIKLRKYAILNNLPMTMSKGQEDLYHLIRDGITGGLSNVHNRFNVRGETTIKKLYYNKETDLVTIIHTNHTVSHCLGVDFNSLYPSAYCLDISEMDSMAQWDNVYARKSQIMYQECHLGTLNNKQKR
jgi:hypothetical protein